MALLLLYMDGVLMATFYVGGASNTRLKKPIGIGERTEKETGGIYHFCHR